MTPFRIALAGAIAVSMACGPGPLPPVARAASERRAGWFPTTSEEPLALDIAIRNDDLDEVRALLDKGADPNARWGQSGDHHPLQELFDTGNGYTVSNRVEAVHLLLERGADPNARWCPFESRADCCGFPSCTSAKGQTVLHWAAGSPYDRTPWLATPISRAFVHAEGVFPYSASRLLLNSGADVNARWCVPVDHRTFKEARAKDPACSVATGISPLMWSASVGHREAVELLLEFKADPSLRDWAGRSALDYAQEPGVRELLSKRR